MYLTIDSRWLFTFENVLMIKLTPKVLSLVMFCVCAI
jgi:hypothetical protein